MTTRTAVATQVLEGPFSVPPASELRPLPATVDLVTSQVRALLLSTPSYHALAERDRQELAAGLVRISAYAAECMRDLCWQSQRLGQTPVVKRRETIAPARDEPTAAPPAALARAQASNFEPRAANQIARITRDTLRAVAFPAFVADLIRGTFDAITRTNDHQMQAFMELVRNVSKSVDDFMEDNISDSQAMDWLAQRYPDHIAIREGRAVPRESQREGPAPNFTRELNLPGSVDVDESSIEDVLVPAARRRLAETRLQMLSTMVLMGMNRIVVTGGKIRATMGFHIDTTDRAREEHATDFDFRFAAQGGVNFALWHVSASTSIAYVTSSRRSSDSEINVETDLTGEVELHFKSDYFPIQRFAGGGTLDAIRGNTPVPAENAPVGADGNPIPAGPPAGPPPGGDGARYQSPRTRRSERPASTLPPLGQLPERRMPVAPDAAPPRPGGEGRGGERGASGDGDASREGGAGGGDAGGQGGAAHEGEGDGAAHGDGGAGGGASGESGGGAGHAGADGGGDDAGGAARHADGGGGAGRGGAGRTGSTGRGAGRSASDGGASGHGAAGHGGSGGGGSADGGASDGGSGHGAGEGSHSEGAAGEGAGHADASHGDASQRSDAGAAREGQSGPGGAARSGASRTGGGRTSNRRGGSGTTSGSGASSGSGAPKQGTPAGTKTPVSEQAPAAHATEILQWSP